MRSATTRMPGRLIAGLIVGLLLVGVAGSAVLVTANDGGGPSAVTLFEQRGGQPVVTTYPSAAEAAAAAAKVSGAAVRVAGAPAGFRLVSFTIYPMPPFPASGMPTRVEAKYEKGSTWVKLLYVGSRFGFPGDEDAANRLPPPKAGQDLFRITTKDFIEYTVLTADRGFVVTLPNPSPLTEAEAIRVLTSVAN